MIEAVIFDLDGVSTDECHYLAWKAIADQENIYFDRTINERLRGVSRKESFEIILEKSNREYTEPEKEKLCTEKNQLYKKLIVNLTPQNILPGAVEVLNFLKDNKIKTAIGSSSKNARLILKQVGLEDAFNVISDGNNIIHSKPHPEVFVVAAKMLQVNPANCIVFEDANSGIDAASSAGMISCGLGYASDYEKANYSFKSLEDNNVIEVLKKLCGI